MGGAWGRLIGVSRRILDSMLLTDSTKDLTHAVLITFMAEITAIMNSRPLVQVSIDCESPTVLTPSLLLTQKAMHEQHQLPEFGKKDLLKSHWKHVQALAQNIWKRWHTE